VGKGNMALALCRQVLDTISSAVFVVGLGRKLMFANAAGDVLLREGGMLSTTNGALTARHGAGRASALEQAIDRALQGDAAAGVSGIGVPLVGADGERAAAYVLPVAGQDFRGCLGPGHCAVFIAQRGEHQPMAVEMLRTMYDMTHAEARVAYFVSLGRRPSDIADCLGISMSTVRSHLKHAFSKSETCDQSSLGALVNQLLPPITQDRRETKLH
jgi:DNA-binding CsgD family transcriptional regulator